MRTNKLTTAQTVAIGTKVQLVHVGRSNEIIMPAKAAAPRRKISMKMHEMIESITDGIDMSQLNIGDDDHTI